MISSTFFGSAGSLDAAGSSSAAAPASSAAGAAGSSSASISTVVSPAASSAPAVAAINMDSRAEAADTEALLFDTTCTRGGSLGLP